MNVHLASPRVGNRVGLLMFSILTAIAVLSLPVQAHANLLQNGSFEGSTSGWTEIGNIALLDSGIGGITAKDGGYFLDLTGNVDYSYAYGGVTQTIATVIGTTYHLSFFGGNYSSNLPEFQEGIVGLLASAGATQQAFTMPAVPSGFLWTQFGFDFVASDTSTAISVVATAGGSYAGLDDVSVIASADLPEPASLTLLGAGLSGLLLRRRHRHSVQY